MWEFLPAPALFTTFQYLGYKDLVNAGKVCHHWYMVSKDEFLWKELFYRNFKVDRSVKIVSGNYELFHWVFVYFEVVLVNQSCFYIFFCT